MRPHLALRLFVLFIVTTQAQSSEPVRVTVKLVETVVIFPKTQVPATAVSLNDAKISAEVRASVIKIPVLVGDIVKLGQILIKLDDKNYKFNLQRARATLKGIDARLSLARYQLEQATTLLLQNAISEEQLRQKRSKVNTLNAEYSEQQVSISVAERDLEKCTIKAPFEAVVTERIIQVGELASPGTSLIRIVDVSRIEISARIQPQDIASIENASTFKFKTQDKTFNVNLRSITPAYDLIQRNREARFTFTQNHALAGASGDLHWSESKPHIPASLIVRRKGQLGVFIVDNNKAKFIKISHATEGRPVEVTLSGATKIIVNGRFSLQNGTDIKIDK